MVIKNTFQTCNLDTFGAQKEVEQAEICQNSRTCLNLPTCSIRIDREIKFGLIMITWFHRYVTFLFLLSSLRHLQLFSSTAYCEQFS